MATPAFSLREDDLVTLLVGPDEEKFVVHEICITRNSDFFKAVMKKEWIEGRTRTVKFPEETCLETFIAYLNFAYHRKLPTESIETVSEDDSLGVDAYKVLAKIYVLGERLLDESVQNAVVEEFARLVAIESSDGKCYYPGSGCVTLIYNGTSTPCELRRMMVDMYSSEGEASWIDKRLPSEFLADLVEELQDFLPNDWSSVARSIGSGLPVRWMPVFCFGSLERSSRASRAVQ